MEPRWLQNVEEHKMESFLLCIYLIDFIQMILSRCLFSIYLPELHDISKQKLSRRMGLHWFFSLIIICFLELGRIQKFLSMRYLNKIGIFNKEQGGKWWLVGKQQCLPYFIFIVCCKTVSLVRARQV